MQFNSACFLESSYLQGICYNIAWGTLVNIDLEFCNVHALALAVVAFDCIL